ncbi:hypothetical protein J19TS1_25270 [Heyndrickxia oleronia]|nr:hypothetical protein J19TS1_25270 [Heyndrickxia oleronia]
MALVSIFLPPYFLHSLPQKNKKPKKEIILPKQDSNAFLGFACFTSNNPGKIIIQFILIINFVFMNDKEIDLLPKLNWLSGKV